MPCPDKHRKELSPNASAVPSKPVHRQPLKILDGSQTSVYPSLWTLDDTKKAHRVILLNPILLGFKERNRLAPTGSLVWIRKWWSFLQLSLVSSTQGISGPICFPALCPYALNGMQGFMQRSCPCTVPWGYGGGEQAWMAHTIIPYQK